MTTFLKVLAAAEEAAISRLALLANISDAKDRLAAIEAELQGFESREIEVGETFDAAIVDLAALGIERPAAERIINDRIATLRAAGLLEGAVPLVEETAEKATRRRRQKKEENTGANGAAGTVPSAEASPATVVVVPPEAPSSDPVVEPEVNTPDVTPIVATDAPEPLVEAAVPAFVAPEPEVVATASQTVAPEVPDFAAEPVQAAVVAPVVEVTPEPEVVPAFAAEAPVDVASSKESIIDNLAAGADGSTIWGDGQSDADLEAQLAASRSMDDQTSDQTTAASRVNRPQEAVSEDKSYGEDSTSSATGGSGEFVDFLNMSMPTDDPDAIPEFM